MSDIDLVYKEMILELYKSPLNKGTLADFDIKQQDFSTSCGDDITVYVKFDESGKVFAVSHDGHGCAISQAAASLLTDEIKCKKKEDVLALTADQMTAMLGVPISHTRMACALLALKTLQKGLHS